MANFKIINDRLILIQVAILFSYFTCIISSCTPNNKISRQANNILLTNASIRPGHTGICIYEPATGKYWYERQSGNYFIPASNTKLFTLYAGLKYLGDSITGLLYQKQQNGSTHIIPTGDPTFLHPGFKNQPVFSFLQSQESIAIQLPPGQFEVYGSGWAWDDYMESYMVPRSAFPMYGNMVDISRTSADSIHIFPEYFREKAIHITSYKNGFDVKREFYNNRLTISEGPLENKKVPFHTDEETITGLLEDRLKIKASFIIQGIDSGYFTPIYSRPSDSLFTPMMHNSDNYLAEQVLLMAGNTYLGYMSDEMMIDSLLKSSLHDVPQKPRWADGSGLSRYNLFTPKSFVYILEKMKNEFGMERMKTILPTGGKGSLSQLFDSASGYIFAKSGTLSNNSALSGYLYTEKGKLLIFSILINHYPGKSAPVRQATEKFLLMIRKKF